MIGLANDEAGRRSSHVDVAGCQDVYAGSLLITPLLWYGRGEQSSCLRFRVLER
jgi:hypothetical protein